MSDTRQERTVFGSSVRGPGRHVVVNDVAANSRRDSIAVKGNTLDNGARGEVIAPVDVDAGQEKGLDDTGSIEGRFGRDAHGEFLSQ